MVAAVKHRTTRDGGKGDITARLLNNFKTMISDGTLAPGCKLPPERELASRFRVNRSSLRQALKVMQLMGVLSQRVGDGTYLSTNAQSILREPIEFLILMGDISDEELFDARMIVEAELAAQAAKRATAHDLAALRRAIAQMEANPSEESRIEADLAFHEAIFRASGNRVCHLIFTVIHRAILLSMSRIVKQVSLETTLRYHKAIYAAIRRGDAEEARRQLREHMADAKSILLTTEPEAAPESPARKSPTRRENTRSVSKR
jgi:GntR family transcriptional repressor for pyruvate dehydrogenase complex